MTDTKIVYVLCDGEGEPKKAYENYNDAMAGLFGLYVKSCKMLRVIVRNRERYRYRSAFVNRLRDAGKLHPQLHLQPTLGTAQCLHPHERRQH